MTFFIKELIFNASEAAWNAIQSDISVRRNLFSLKGDIDYPWYRASHQHDYSSSGLFVIRPICAEKSGAKSWFNEEDKIAKSDAFMSPDKITLEIDWRDIQRKTCLSPEAFQAEVPLNILKYAKALSETIGSPVVYYDACYWGGSIEYELAWVFGEKEEVIVQLADSEHQSQICRVKPRSEIETKGEVLQSALAMLDVDMSSGFFLPHTRGFEWIEKKVR